VLNKNNNQQLKLELQNMNDCNKIEITIHTAKPGLFIGNSATELKNIYNNLKTQISSNRNLIINILEIKTPDSQAELIGDVIVALLEKRIAFRKAVINTILRQIMNTCLLISYIVFFIFRKKIKKKLN
jgi:small subunit ribosomal protein S3